MTTCAIISIIILPGMILKGIVLLRARAHSLMSRICRSMSGTCSLAAVVLWFTPCPNSSMHRLSNSLSIRAVRVSKPRALYNLTIFNNYFIRFGSDRLETYSIVENFNFRDKLITNGMPLMNNTSAARVTSLFRSMLSFGMAT
jgi:hypothetical protein